MTMREYRPELKLIADTDIETEVASTVIPDHVEEVDLLDAYSRGVIGASEAVSPSVVNISVKPKSMPDGRPVPEEMRGTGSGFVFTTEGLTASEAPITPREYASRRSTSSTWSGMTVEATSVSMSVSAISFSSGLYSRMVIHASLYFYRHLTLFALYFQ